MKDFGAWFSEQGAEKPRTTEEIDDTIYFVCSCGKWEYVSIAEFINGDTPWYWDHDIEPGGRYLALCGSGPHCLP